MLALSCNTSVPVRPVTETAIVNVWGGGVVIMLPPPQAEKDSNATATDTSRNDFITIRTPVFSAGDFLGGKTPVRSRKSWFFRRTNVAATIHGFGQCCKGETTCNY